MKILNLYGKNKIKLIDGLNKQGFILEDRFWRVVECLDIVQERERNLPFEFKNDSGEIDAVIKLHNSKKLVIECKKTFNSWFFPIREKEIGNVILRKIRQTGFHYDVRKSNVYVTNSNSTVTFSDKFDIQDKPQKQVREAYIELNNNILQLLKNFNYVINQKDSVPLDYFSILITNTNLIIMEYSENDISDDGNLKDYRKLAIVPFLIYNFPKRLLWDGESQEFKPFEEKTPSNMRDWYSTFIININHVPEAFKSIMLDNYFT